MSSGLGLASLLTYIPERDKATKRMDGRRFSRNRFVSLAMERTRQPVLPLAHSSKRQRRAVTALVPVLVTLITF